MERWACAVDDRHATSRYVPDIDEGHVELGVLVSDDITGVDALAIG